MAVKIGRTYIIFPSCLRMVNHDQCSAMTTSTSTGLKMIFDRYLLTLCGNGISAMLWFEKHGSLDRTNRTVIGTHQRIVLIVDTRFFDVSLALLCLIIFPNMHLGSPIARDAHI